MYSGTPYEYKVWVFDVIQSATAVGLSLIPAVGPLLSIAFTIGISAITDPDTFKTENILTLSPEALAAVCTSAAAMRKNIPKGFFTRIPK